MNIQPGVYNINNDNNGYAMMMYANDAEGVPVVCVPDANGQTVRLFLSSFSSLSNAL